MILNDQLDNEKQTFVYQIDLYKDDLEEMEENYIRLTREHREKSKVKVKGGESTCSRKSQSPFPLLFRPTIN